ncbi:MAG: DinB family protein [Armatimonadetes bacterium]|nr:DinB family protein [Armatimonadota bacterium]
MPDTLHVWETVLQAMEGTPVVLRKLADLIPAEAFERRPHPDLFSPGEILHHLAEMEGILLKRYRLMAGSENPYLPDHDPQERLDENAYVGKTVEEGVDRFAAARAASLEFLRSLPPGDRTRSGEHSLYGPMTLEMQAQKSAAHDLTHIADILART